MIPRSRASRGPTPSVLGRLVLPSLILLAACGGSAAPIVSFDPATPCTTDGRQPGAYPELEALLPAEYEGQPPSSVDSGRSCTPDALGTLGPAGIEGVRFAGATWPLGGTSGLTVAVFEGDGLDATDMISFYEAGARAARRTEKLTVSEITVAGRPARRLDVLGADGTGQTIVAWPTGDEGRVRVLLAADLGDARVLEALDSFGSP